jgi:ABC-type sugar transport system ATPase subunit
VPEDRRLAGLIVDFNVRENISLPNLESYSSAKIINYAKEATAARRGVQSNQHQDADAGNASRKSQWRQPAKGGAGEVADVRAASADF